MDDIVFDTLENAMYLNQEDTATLHTVKYQRTETTEEWGWENIVKPAIIDVEELPDNVTDANKGNIYRLEGDSTYMAADYDGELYWDAIATQVYVDSEISYANPSISIQADLSYNQDGTISGIDVTNIVTSGDADWTELNWKAIDTFATFILKMSGNQIGTIDTCGIMTKYSMQLGPAISATNYRFTFPFINMSIQSQGTLFIDYNDADDAWTVTIKEY